MPNKRRKYLLFAPMPLLVDTAVDASKAAATSGSMLMKRSLSVAMR